MLTSSKPGYFASKLWTRNPGQPQFRGCVLTVQAQFRRGVAKYDLYYSNYTASSGQPCTEKIPIIVKEKKNPNVGGDSSPPRGPEIPDGAPSWLGQ